MRSSQNHVVHSLVVVLLRPFSTFFDIGSIVRRSGRANSPAEHGQGQDQGRRFQSRFRGKRLELRADFCFRPVGTDGSWLEIGISHRDLRLVGTEWSGVDAVATRRRAWGRVPRHPQPPQLPLPVRCLISDVSAGRHVPAPVASSLPQVFPNCRTSGSKLQVLPQWQLRAYRTSGRNVGCS